MSQSDITTTEPLIRERLTLLKEQELSYQLDSILQRMQRLAESHQIGKKGPHRSPLRNLLVTATDRTASLEIIKNYIRYQIARPEDIGKVLVATFEGEKFGDALIKELDGLKQNAETILNSIATRLSDTEPLKQYLTPELPSREVTDLHLKLVQLYLGYLVRQHTSMRAASGNNNDQSPASADPTARPSRGGGDNRPKPKSR